jgi:BirA family biotin operon repressor/biotin-[acetyl-CoA-carboxylase] ligase
MIGKKIIHLDSVDSTNNYVANMILNNQIEHGTVIMSDEQTAGKGQRGNLWFSKPGENVITSIYLKPANLSVNQQFYLTIFTSLSVIRLLQKKGIEAKIKWPNDIVVNSKKISGILIENQLISTKIDHSVIGIGLNTNQKEFSDLNATSIFNETSEFNPIHHVLLSLIGEMNQLFVELENENFEKLKSEYLENLWLLNTISSFTDEKGEFMGKIIGVSEIGLLQILNNNQLKEYNLKELKFNARNEF